MAVSDSTWQNSRWLPSSSYVRRKEFESDWNEFEVRLLCEMAESKMAVLEMAELKMAAIIFFFEKEWVWTRLN